MFKFPAVIHGIIFTHFMVSLYKKRWPLCLDGVERTALWSGRVGTAGEWRERRWRRPWKLSVRNSHRCVCRILQNGDIQALALLSCLDSVLKSWTLDKKFTKNSKELAKIHITPTTSQVQDLILPPRGAAIPVRRGHGYSAVAFVYCRLWGTYDITGSRMHALFQPVLVILTWDKVFWSHSVRRGSPSEHGRCTNLKFWIAKIHIQLLLISQSLEDHHILLDHHHQ